MADYKPKYQPDLDKHGILKATEAIYDFPAPFSGDDRKYLAEAVLEAYFEQVPMLPEWEADPNVENSLARYTDTLEKEVRSCHEEIDKLEQGIEQIKHDLMLEANYSDRIIKTIEIALSRVTAAIEQHNSNKDCEAMLWATKDILEKQWSEST